MSGVTSLIFRLDFPTSFEYTLSDTAIDENISSLYGGFGLLISTQTSNSSTMGLISPTRFCFIKLFDFPPDYQSLYIKKPQRSRRHYTHCKFLHEAHYIMNIRHPFVILRSLLLLEYSLITITVTLIFWKTKKSDEKKTLLKSICELGIRSIFRLVLVIVGGQMSIHFELKKSLRIWRSIWYGKESVIWEGRKLSVFSRSILEFLEKRSRNAETLLQLRCWWWCFTEDLCTRVHWKSCSYAFNSHVYNHFTEFSIRDLLFFAGPLVLSFSSTPR